jgi:hypothetical protein
MAALFCSQVPLPTRPSTREPGAIITPVAWASLGLESL